jgi:hypothetical protein
MHHSPKRTYMHVQLLSQVQPYIYVYIRSYFYSTIGMFRLHAIIRYFVSWLKSLHCTIIFAFALSVVLCYNGLMLKYKSLFKIVQNLI